MINKIGRNIGVLQTTVAEVVKVKEHQREWCNVDVHYRIRN